MPEDFDLLNPDVIRRIIMETQKSEDKDRRRQSFNAYQVYSGNQRTYVVDQLCKTRPKSWQSYTVSNISVSKMVTDKRSQAYNEKPIRSVEGNPIKTEMLDELYKQADAARELQFMDVVYNLNKYTLMWVNYRPMYQTYQFMNLHPYEFTLVRDKNDGRLLVVGLNYPNTEITSQARGNGNSYGYGTSNLGGDGVPDLIAESQADSAAQGQTWVFWSAEHHVKVRVATVPVDVNGIKELKVNVDYIQDENNPDMRNPIGMLPFVLVTKDTAVDYPTVNPLTEQSIMFNAQQSETLTAKNVHGSGIMVFKYPEKFEGEFKQQSQGQTQAIGLPQSSNPDDKSTEFEYKTSGAQLGPMMDSDKLYLEQIFHEHGLENIKMDGSGVDMQSGVSKAIAGSSVQKIVEQNQQQYANLEKEMFKIIKAWDRALNTRMFSEEDELTIVYPKPKVMLSDRETLDNIKMMLELELIEEWEKFQKMDPNLSEDEAKEKLARIEDRKLMRAAQFMMGNDANQQESIDEESEARPNGFIS